MDANDYRLFKSYLDPDLLKPKLWMECERGWPLPFPYQGEEAARCIASALVRVGEKHGGSRDDELTPRERAFVKRARDQLLCALIAYMGEYSEQEHNNIDWLVGLIALDEKRRCPGANTPLECVFNVIMTGLTIPVSGRKQGPCNWKRNTDGKEPGKNTHSDGTHGFTAEEDDAVKFFQRYMRTREVLHGLHPDVDYVAYIKAPLAFMGKVGSEIYSVKEKRMKTFEERIDGLKKAYVENVEERGYYDLLERLMIESLLTYVNDCSVPLGMREGYVPQLTALIDGDTKGDNSSETAYATSARFPLA